MFDKFLKVPITISLRFMKSIKFVYCFVIFKLSDSIKIFPPFWQKMAGNETKPRSQFSTGRLDG